jgi:biotin operon repressor
MTTRRLGSLDLDTGEVYEGVAVWVGPKIRSPYGRRFFMSNQDALEALAKDTELSGQTLRVFLYLCSRIDFENFIQVPQVDIARELGIGRNKVSEAVARLQGKGIIIRGPKVGRACVFRLNPHYGWKGKVSSLQRARTEHLKVINGRDQAGRESLEARGQARLAE